MLMPCPPLEEDDIQELQKEAERLLSQTKGFLRWVRGLPWIPGYSLKLFLLTVESIMVQTSLPTEENPLLSPENDDYEEFRNNRLLYLGED